MADSHTAAVRGLAARFAALLEELHAVATELDQLEHVLRSGLARDPTDKEQLKAALRSKFGSLKAFERAYGLPENATRDLLRGRASRLSAEAVANAVSLSVETLFPGRFKTMPKLYLVKSEAV